MVLTLRIYKPKDKKKTLKFMRSVDKDFNPPIDSREGGLNGYLENVLDKKYQIYLLEDYRFYFFFPRIIGVVMTFDEGRNKVIKYLAISEKYRQQGHGKEILEMALLDIKKSKKIMLRTWLTNSVAISFYEKFGFSFYKIADDKDRMGKDRSIYMKLEEENFDR